jgi:hypothetical protein
MEELYQQGKIEFTSKGTPRRKRYLDDMPGVPMQDLWTDIPAVNSQASEATTYATQKPEALLKRIVEASSDEGDVVLDCFLGSGTTGAVAHKMKRRWIGIESSKETIDSFTHPRLTSVSTGRIAAASQRPSRGNAAVVLGSWKSRHLCSQRAKPKFS